MAKCTKCGREYVTFHAKNTPQPKQMCPYCDKDQNRENRQKFLKDQIERAGSKPEN